MAAQRERVLLGARDAGFACVIFRDQTGRKIDVGIAFDQRRVRRDLVAAHRHEAHRLGAAGDDRRGRAAHDPLGGVGDRLQARRAEAIDGDGRRGDRNARAQARDPRHVHALFRLGHRAPHDHIVDLARIDAGRALERLGDGGGAELVGPRAAQGAARRLARRGSHRRHDDRVSH